MTQLTIEIKDNKTLKLIQDLEALKLIRVLKEKTSSKKGKSLSERLSGSLSIRESKQLEKELRKMRLEWERGI